jgi:hypothetical protein
MSKTNAQGQGGSKLGRLATRQGPGAISRSRLFLISKANARVRSGSKLGKLAKKNAHFGYHRQKCRWYRVFQGFLPSNFTGKIKDPNGDFTEAGWI